MAAVTVVKARPCTPVGYEVSDKGTLVVDVVAGDLLVIAATGWDKAPITGITEAHGIALKDGFAGGIASVGIHGEMDGFSGLTPGAPLYPSVATVGKIDTAAIAAATVRIRAVNASRIRFSFV